MIHEIAGHTFYLRHIVCVHPLFEESASVAHLNILTTGGEVTLTFRDLGVSEVRQQVAALIDAMHMQSDDDRNWGADEPR